MQQVAEKARYVMIGAATRARGISDATLHRAARRGEIIPVMRAPGGFARFDNGDVSTCAARPRGGISAEGGC